MLVISLNESGELSGFLTGMTNVEVLTGELLNTEARREAAIVAPFFERNADMVLVDGVCTYISLGLSLEGVNAYVLRDQAREREVESR